MLVEGKVLAEPRVAAVLSGADWDPAWPAWDAEARQYEGHLPFCTLMFWPYRDSPYERE